MGMLKTMSNEDKIRILWCTVWLLDECPSFSWIISAEVTQPVSLCVLLQSRWRKSILESRKCPHRPGESSASHVLRWETSGNCQRGDCLCFTSFLRIQLVATIRLQPPLLVVGGTAGNNSFFVCSNCMYACTHFCGHTKHKELKGIPLSNSMFCLCQVIFSH